MDITSLRELYDREQRRDAEYPETLREATLTITRHTINIGRRQGWVIWSKLDENSVEDAITEQINHFESIACDFEWKVYDYDTPSDLTGRLAARGFTIGEPPDAIMVLDIEKAGNLLEQPVPDTIRRLQKADEVPLVIQMLETIWNESMTGLGAELENRIENLPDTISIYAAFDGTQPVSAAWTFYDNTQFCGLWGGSTLPDFRRRGLYTGLLAIRANEARTRGKRYLTVDASPMSRPILEKFGFVCIATATECTWEVST